MASPGLKFVVGYRERGKLEIDIMTEHPVRNVSLEEMDTASHIHPYSSLADNLVTGPTRIVAEANRIIAEDAASMAFLRGLIRRAGRGRPDERPTFQELLDRVDEFIAKPLPQTPGPKERLYKSSVIQGSAHRRKAFWDYASVSFTDLGHAGGVLVDGVVQRLCDDRGLACWQSQVDGHGKDVPVPAHLGEEVVDRTKNKYGPLTAEDAEDSGTLDILDGEFPFNVTRVHQALPPKVFAFKAHTLDGGPQRRISLAKPGFGSRSHSPNSPE